MSIPPINVNVVTHTVTAKSRTLKGTWSLTFPNLPSQQVEYPIYTEARYTDNPKELDEHLRHLIIQLGRLQQRDRWEGYQTPHEVIMFASLAESVAPSPVFSLHNFAETFNGLSHKTRNDLLKDLRGPDESAFIHEAFSYVIARSYPHRLDVNVLDVDAFRADMISKGINGRIAVRCDDAAKIAIFCNDPTDFTMVRLLF